MKGCRSVAETGLLQQGRFLFNLEDDLGETKNLIDQKPEVAAELKKALKDWLKQLKRIDYRMSQKRSDRAFRLPKPLFDETVIRLSVVYATMGC